MTFTCAASAIWWYDRQKYRQAVTEIYHEDHGQRISTLSTGGFVEDIALLEDYLQYWEKEFHSARVKSLLSDSFIQFGVFQANTFEQYCTTMFLGQLPDGTYARNEKYYLLCDILPQDYELRHRLREERLKTALERHHFEECLFCRTVIKGLRADYLDHLFDKHFLLVGKPEKLVYVDELLDQLEANLNQLICLYCEKVFKDRTTLKEHMRKKGHKRINPNRREYDKYFLINYNRVPAPAPRKQQHQKRRQPTGSVSADMENMDFDKHFARPDSEGEHDSDWSDWAGDGEPHSLKCLYCPHLGDHFAGLKQHMIDAHSLDFDVATSALNFYQRVKVVKYILCMRRSVSCDIQFDDIDLLTEHMAQESHCGIGERSSWDKPEFFFPYMENDGLLL
ncbi:zinc finger protein 277-like [Drosophila miranda]|uniref:zinc finger protein 277-like n=1 Tax=Drosophila miranda TaxID=7229 RepID=UPI00143F4932|nr:zinc finger protein 277-like [Drosophila miranda]XP_033252305.1 zinc finger protein 277-like [Drosophila miranda]